MSLFFLLESEAYKIFWKGVLRTIRAINKCGEIGTREFNLSCRFGCVLLTGLGTYMLCLTDYDCCGLFVQ